ncbi:SRPBCC family protein [Streptomyces sp. NPDC059466]|uniref:SRPBCC family protein n=1 Tax=unclassified Streptomyces TaxID=2593676 RepID=UPI00368F615E
MSQVEKSIEVDVSLRVAYNQWTHFESFPRFLDGVERVTQINDFVIHWKTEVEGVTREFDAEITEQIPDERVAWTVVGEPTWSAVVTFDHLDEVKTRVTLRLDYNPQGFAEKLGDKLGLVKRRVSGDLKNFKEYIESRGPDTGSEPTL